MLETILILIVISLAVYLLLKWDARKNDLFEKQGLKYLKPLPFIGSAAETFKGIGIADRILTTYRRFPNEKIIGFFDINKTVYFLRSPEAIKKITIRDFPYFQDRMALIDPSIDEYFGNILFSMRGKEWRDMRTTLTTLFTGSKMRLMLQFINKCAEQMVEHLKEAHNSQGLHPTRIKEIFSRYTNDAIATSAFGVECNSFKCPSNEIYTTGQKLLQFQKSLNIKKFLLMRYFPKFCKWLGLQVIDQKVKDKFKGIILNTMEERKKRGIIRPDMLQLLIKLRDGQETKLEDDEVDEVEAERKILNGQVKSNFTEVEIVAQTFLFFLAGFDTTSTVMTFTAYELALNPDVQLKLISEIDDTNKGLDGKPLTYEVLQKMKYLDMVILEVLRKWPPSIATDRECIKTYNYVDDDGGLNFTIEKGSLIWVPIYGLHMDPQYFPEPEKFYPERFSDKNADTFVQLAFGVGPRICIGSRFAMMEMKVLFFYLLSNFKINVCEETDIPLKLKKSIFGLVPTKEIKLHLEPRSHA